MDVNRPPAPSAAAPTGGEVLTAISEGLVALLKQFDGRGPTSAKTYYQGELVRRVLRGGSSRVEQTLLEGGRAAAVNAQRADFQALSYLMCEVFVLAAVPPRSAG